MAESTGAMTSAADRPQEFSMDEPEENEKKPFYKSTLFIVIAAIILLALLLGVIGTVLYFTVLKESDDNGAPSTDAANVTSQGPSSASPDVSPSAEPSTTSSPTEVVSSMPSTTPGQNAGDAVTRIIEDSVVHAVETKPGESD